MHVLFRESHGLDETATPKDLGQTPADLVVLSFSDSDLGAFAAGWHRGRAHLPTLRLANLANLTHPLSIDTYIERTISGAKAVMVRLIGGASWWQYGVDELTRLAKRDGIRIAFLPGDGRPNPGLRAASNIGAEVIAELTRLCDAGGDEAAEAALSLLAQTAGLTAHNPKPQVALGPYGFWHPTFGTAAPTIDDRPLIAIPFYRAWLAAADTDGIAALISECERQSFRAVGLFVPSLKDDAAAAWLRATLRAIAPAAIVNATAFSARSEDGSPLDTSDAPVFQVIHATNDRGAWAGAEKGLSPADTAMHVALPEVDGRVQLGVVSFKEAAVFDPALQWARVTHRADPHQIRRAVARVAAWHRLRRRANAERRVALILSTYPGKAHRMAHAVGLDAIASAEAMLGDLHGAGYATRSCNLTEALSSARLHWPLSDYRAAFRTLPGSLQRAITDQYGAPEDDPSVDAGALTFSAVRIGQTIVALQPERSGDPDREGEYHDTTRLPCHGYIGFYLWLQSQVDALVHIGAHGTLEWLPGKAVALSGECWPEVLTGALPVIYPFIVNDPGEAAQARRRLGAVTLGHLPPPMAEAGVPTGLAALERLLDEYATAEGLDTPRQRRLIDAIRAEAQAAGVEDDLAIPLGASAAEAIPQIDRFVCDVKDSQFGDGLHIWGRGTPNGDAFTGDARSIASEREALIDALAGRRIAPGPSGSPYRGRMDVLPTGRNLFGIDPRAVPSKTAHAQGVRLAEELLRRHLQEHGDWPGRLVMNLWGSATMRTAGEEFAMALHLAGVAPQWDAQSGRVTGFEILPLTLLDRPRVDVTIRISGLFRDVFPDLARFFEAAAAALAERDEAADMNPYRASAPGPRVFAPAPASYGLGMSFGTFSAEARAAAGEAWLRASAHSADGTLARDMLETRVLAADAFVHVQDLPETDLLLAEDYAAHEGGFAAALERLGRPAPALYHLDATRSDAPRARALPEEIARVVRARAANPRWLQAMTRHGFRGGAEIAATLEHLAAFAHLAGVVPPHLFDLYHAATLGDPTIRDFLSGANPGALRAMEDTFDALAEAGLWQSRSNSRRAGLG